MNVSQSLLGRYFVKVGVWQHSDNLRKSKSLQHDTTTAAEGQQLAKVTIDVLKSIRKEDKFKYFYDHVLLHQSAY